MKRFITFFSIIIFTIVLNAQNVDPNEFAEQTIQDRQEFYFKFECDSITLLKELAQNISIDKVQGKTIFAYANPEEWEYFKTKNLKYEPVWDYYFAPKSIVMATTLAQMENWDRYPTHAVYLEMLDSFAANYPSLCKVELIGNSVNGKPIKCLVISDNVNSSEDEPSFWWSGTMHGDETTGWILLLRLADYLLSNYGIDPQVTYLVNNIKIYINPLANPDGTFYGSSTYTSIANARRNNQNNVDLNRNFPKVLGGTISMQPEIQIMMDYVTDKQFVMSANTHGGIELINYPWDCWRTVENAHPDDNWWYYVSTVYVNNVRAISPSTYFDGPGQMYDGSYNYTGITQGADWYYVYGSRQDWMNYFAYIKEVTLELSDTKKLDVEYLNNHWDYNKQAMLDYMQQVLYGFRGIVTDACTGQPLSGVKVEIVGHDKDNSHVYSFAPVGNYHRPIYAGTYNVTFSKSGYQSVTHTVTVQNNQSTRLDVQLYPTGVAIPNFTASQVNVPVSTNITFTDQSAGGTVSSRIWTFNGGNPSTSTDQNPVVNYANPGNYNVNLQIVSNGCTLNELKENYIHVYVPGAPLANFQANKTFTCDGIIQFTDLSQDAVSYLWNFGDGNTSSQQNPQHTYTADGVYTVSLTVSNANGSDTKTITDYITIDLVESPVVQGAESCGAASLTLSASGGNVLQWYDAPTGGNLLFTGTSLTQNFTQTTTYYVQSGYSEAIYDAGNTQINTNGSNHTASNAYYLIFDAYKPFRLVSVQVNSGTTGSRIIELRNSSDQVLQTITVNLTTGINTVTLNWDIPQGSNYRLKCGTSTPNLWRNNTGTNFPYTLPGVLSITGTNAGDTNYYYYFYNWKVLYGDECVSVRTPVTAAIHEVPGTVTVSGGGSQCGGSMTLTATGGSGGTIYWQGTTSNGTSTSTPSTSQTVSASGTYYFRALAGSSCWGPQGSATVTIYPALTLSTSVQNETNVGANDGSITVTITGGTQPFVGEWNTNDITNSSGNTMIYSGLTGGAYSVTVTDFNGCTSSTSAIVNTSGSAPFADFAASLTSGCDILTVQFTDLSNNNPSSWYWEFGDGQTSTLQNPVHTYSQPGNYTVSLTVSNTFGSNTHTENNFITIGNTPEIVLTMTEETVAGNDGTASVIVTGGVEPISIFWNNGMQSNTITGLAAGNYCVTVSDNFGCSVSGCIEVTHENITGQPVADFTANQTQACGSLTVQFTDLSQNNPTSWQWNFGDGETSSEQNPIHIYSSAGSYTVILTVSNDYGNDVKVVENYIKIWTIPQIEFIVTHESYSGASDGSIELIINGGTAPYTILWSNGMSGEYISGLPGGLYSVAVIDFNGCYTTSSVFVETSTVVNVCDENLKVYPNPANSHITIEAYGLVETASIVNTLGQKIIEIAPQSERFVVNISTLREGVYFLKLLINGNEFKLKLIKN